MELNLLSIVNPVTIAGEQELIRSGSHEMGEGQIVPPKEVGGPEGPKKTM